MSDKFIPPTQIDWFITQMKIKGGVERLVFNLLPILNEQGWKIRLITLTRDQDYSIQLKEQGIEVVSLDAHAKWDIKALAKLFHLWKTSPPVILHTHLYHAGIVGRWVGHLCGIPIILCHQAGPELDRSRFRSYLDSLSNGLVNLYLVSCQAVANILHQREGIPYSKISLIPNGIPIPPQPKQYLHQAHDTPLKLITIGRLTPEKNQRILLSVVTDLIQAGIPFHLDILGEGKERINLEKLSKKLGIADHISFQGYQTNPAEWLNNADIFILPSKWEGVSLALLEAMAMALPVIATNRGGTIEVIQPEQTGILVSPDNPQEIIQAVQRLYLNPQYRQTLGNNARKFIEENYSIQSTLQKLEELYQAQLSKLSWKK